MKFSNTLTPLDNRGDFPTAEQNRVHMTFIDYTGSKHADVSLSLDLTAEQIIERLVRANFLPDNLGVGQAYDLSLKHTGQRLAPNQTLRELGAEDGNIITAAVMTRGGGGLPIRSFRDIQLIEAVLLNKGLKREWSGLYALLLYTKLDRHLARYVRIHFIEMSWMAGQDCLFFVMESPSLQGESDAREWLGAYLTNSQATTIWKRLGIHTFEPVERATAYDLGKNFGVMPSQFPCVVIFSDLKGRDALIIPMANYLDLQSSTPKEELTKFFRTLFSSVNSVVDESKRNRLSKLKKLLRKVQSSRVKSLEPLELSKLGVSVIDTITSIIGVLVKQ